MTEEFGDLDISGPDKPVPDGLSARQIGHYVLMVTGKDGREMPAKPSQGVMQHQAFIHIDDAVTYKHRRHPDAVSCRLLAVSKDDRPDANNGKHVALHEIAAHLQRQFQTKLAAPAAGTDPKRPGPKSAAKPGQGLKSPRPGG